MLDRIKTFLDGLLLENGCPSLTRVLSVVGYLAFLIASAYLIINEQRWDHYETFAAITGGGGACTQVANKLINSKYNPGMVKLSGKEPLK